jgi:hypothetical protein
MHFLLALLFSCAALAAPWKPAWTLSLPGQPRAAYFFSGDNKILVSLETDDGKAEVLQVSPAGRLLGTLEETKGEAGPMRSYGDKVYWAVGKEVYSFFGKEGGSFRLEAKRQEPVTDLALDSKGRLTTGSARGLEPAAGRVRGPIAGLFMLGEKLYYLSRGRVGEVGGKSEKVCASCRGLETAQEGGWITVEGDTVIRTGKKKALLAKLPSAPGRIGYLYRLDSSEDLLLVPLPQERQLSAFHHP